MTLASRFLFVNLHSLTSKFDKHEWQQDHTRRVELLSIPIISPVDPQLGVREILHVLP